MRDNYDFSDAVKKPEIARRLKEEGHTVIIHYGAAQGEKKDLKEYTLLQNETTVNKRRLCAKSS